VPEEHRLDIAVVTIDGEPLPPDVAERLIALRVDESVHLPDTFTLRFDDPHFTLFDQGTMSLGTAVTVAMRAESDPVTVTAGEVTALTVEEGGSGRHQLVVQGMDHGHRLARRPRTRTFQQMSDADIATQVAADAGLRADVRSTGEPHEYVLQHNETDYAFLAGRARRIGFELWVSDQTLHFAPTPSTGSPPPLVWGENLHRWKVRFSSTERCDEVRVAGWDPERKEAIEGRARPDDVPAATTADAAAALDRDAREAFGETSRFAGRFPVASQAEADALAAGLAARASGTQVIARGEAIGDPRLGAGAEVSVERVGDRLTGRYRLTAAEHLYAPGTPYVTRFVCGGRDPAGLSDLLGMQEPGGARSWQGLAVGTVTNNRDPEGLGRVKVTFPTLQEPNESTWARLTAPGAGGGRGLQCLPEVGDEVLVGFEHDDVHRPVVLGGLWSRTDPPPDPDAPAGGETRRRSWVSRDGHRLEFRDGTAPGATLEADEVEIVAARRLVLRAPRIEIAADGPCEVSGTPIRLN
jgi:uncharacterized protein involved in type VI secretion and phage assembly